MRCGESCVKINMDEIEKRNKNRSKQLCIRILPNRWLALPSFKTFDREDLELIKMYNKTSKNKGDEVNK